MLLSANILFRDLLNSSFGSFCIWGVHRGRALDAWADWALGYIGQHFDSGQLRAQAFSRRAGI